MIQTEGIVAVPCPPRRATSASYSELKRLIKDRGLLERRPMRALLRLVIIDALLALSIALLLSVHIFWAQCINALFLAFVCSQIGFIGHDAGHRQSSNSTRLNDLIGFIHGNLFSGMSFSWWMEKHNAHHAHPNEIDCDPDIDIPMLSFTTEDAVAKRGILRFIAAHQVWFFFPLLAMVAFHLQMNSVRFLMRGKARHRKTEIALLLLHYVGYFGLLLIALSPWQALLFLLIHKVATGLYLGSVFAPNHKGMLVLERGSDMDFLSRQVLTSRNVRAHPILDTWYGGLNYQIEHHLFPAMPRSSLAEAQRIIRAYCQLHAISYHETSMARSYREILASLHDIGAPLRGASAMASL